MLGGYPVFLGLSVTALIAAVALSRRFEADSRSESVVVAGMSWVALIAAPIYALGMANRLTAPTLAVVAFATHTVTVLIASWKQRWRICVRECLRLATGAIAAPFQLSVTALRARSGAFVGLVAAAVTLTYCAVVTWYAPSFRHWDCLWYHEPIVALTIQNHGFVGVDVPDSLQRVNGYPRMGEMICLWFVIFTDRRLIELPSVLGAGLYMVGTYALCRRFGATRTAATGWATGLLFLPAVFGGLQSAMIDLQLAAYTAAGLVLAVRPRLRVRDAVGVVIIGAITINTKYLGLVTALSTAAVTGVRLVAATRRLGGVRVGLALGFGTAVLGGALAHTVLHNYFVYNAPFWPHQLQIKSLNYTSAGWIDRGPGGNEGLVEPYSVVADYLYASPATWAHGDVRDGITNYGLSVPWVAFPQFRRHGHYAAAFSCCNFNSNSIGLM